MREASIERAFVKYAASKGCVALKLRIDGINGFPDRTVLTPRGVFFVEFKTKKGKLRPAQVVWGKRLRSLGFQCVVVNEVGEAERLLDEILTARISEESHRLGG